MGLLVLQKEENLVVFLANIVFFGYTNFNKRTGIGSGSVQGLRFDTDFYYTADLIPVASYTKGGIRHVSKV